MKTITEKATISDYIEYYKDSGDDSLLREFLADIKDRLNFLLDLSSVGDNVVLVNGLNDLNELL